MQTRIIVSRDSSPVGSEISVGSPSPPPSECERNGDDYFQPLKRLKMIDSEDNNNHSDASRTNSSSKSTVEGVKSFSIADILGRDTSKSSVSPRDTISSLAHNLHQQARIVRPWDHLQHPISIRPLLPPALLHYEQRLAMDYHQQLQEHFRAQAQLLRHMNLEIIPSESGSERSSSVASDCCSPDIGRSSENSGRSQSQQQQQKQKQQPSGNKSPNGTPLDALFQLSNKNFDEQQNEGGECTGESRILVVISERITQHLSAETGVEGQRAPRFSGAIKKFKASRTSLTFNARTFA